MPIGGICAGQLYLGGDGKLWHWDIFNQHVFTNESHYAQPMRPSSPLAQGFGIRILAAGKATFRPLDHSGFSDISFCGQYPLATVEYRDAASPLAVSLAAYSPFIPLDAKNSSLPATVLQYCVKNSGSDDVKVELFGWLENAVGLHSGGSAAGKRQNLIRRELSLLMLECFAAEPELAEPHEHKTDVPFEDFQKETYEGWEVTGEAFGKGPILKSQIPAYQGEVGSKGPRVVNSHASAPATMLQQRTPKPARLQAGHLRSSGATSISGLAVAAIPAKRASICSSTASRSARPPAMTATPCGASVLTPLICRAKPRGCKSSITRAARGGTSALRKSYSATLLPCCRSNFGISLISGPCRWPCSDRRVPIGAPCARNRSAAERNPRRAGRSGRLLRQTARRRLGPRSFRSNRDSRRPSPLSWPGISPI